MNEMDLRDKILARMEPSPDKEARRQIMISIPRDKIAMLEKIAKAITLESGTHVSRNMLIQDAIEASIEEANWTLGISEQSEEMPEEEPGLALKQGQSM